MDGGCSHSNKSNFRKICRFYFGNGLTKRAKCRFNSDQGAQFTSEAFTNVLTRAGIVISREGRGRVFDNLFVERLWRSVKHEDLSLKGTATMDELKVGLTAYFAFYNGERPYQPLG